MDLTSLNITTDLLRLMTEIEELLNPVGKTSLKKPLCLQVQVTS